MRTYLLSARGVKPILRRMAERYIFFLVTGASLSLGLTALPLLHTGHPGVLLALAKAGLTLTLLGAVALAVAQQRWAKTWNDYRLVIEDCVISKQAPAPLTTIHCAQITRVQELGGAGLSFPGLVIKTNAWYKSIFIPASLDGYEEIKQYLNDWCDLEPATWRTFMYQSPLPGALLGCSLLAGYFLLLFNF